MHYLLFTLWLLVGPFVYSWSPGDPITDEQDLIEAIKKLNKGEVEEAFFEANEPIEYKERHRVLNADHVLEFGRRKFTIDGRGGKLRSKIDGVGNGPFRGFFIAVL